MKGSYQADVRMMIIRMWKKLSISNGDSLLAYCILNGMAAGVASYNPVGGINVCLYVSEHSI